MYRTYQVQSAAALSTVLRTTMLNFLWKHAILAYLPNWNPSTDQYDIFTIHYVGNLPDLPKMVGTGWLGVAPQIGKI
jgi:hypothetical protein